MRLKLSLADSLRITAIVAVGLAALSRPSCLWASLIFSLLLLSITVACFGVALRRGPGRAFWSGFLAWGSLYAVLSMAPWFDSHVSHRLFTTAILDLLYPGIPALAPSDPMRSDAWKSWTGTPPDSHYAHPRVGFTLGGTDAYHKDRAFFTVVTSDAFLMIGHSLFAMALGVVGGVLVRRAYEDRERPEDRDRATNEPSP